MSDKAKAEGEKAVDDYLAGVDEPFTSILQHLRRVIRATAPEALEGIGYGIPTYKLDGNLVHFAAFRNHMSFFPGGTAHNETFKDELKGYKLAKGTIQFTPGNLLPDDLVTRIVKARIEENREIAVARKAAKSRK